jgi:hypothetical protein
VCMGVKSEYIDQTIADGRHGVGWGLRPPYHKERRVLRNVIGLGWSLVNTVMNSRVA